MATERSSLLGEIESTPGTGTLASLFENPNATTFVPTFKSERDEGEEKAGTSPKRSEFLKCSVADAVSSLAGSAVFVVYHVVFCLAQAATIAPTVSATGSLAQVAALGTIVAAPVFVYELGDHIPAIYPASDLFLAPFLAELAEKIYAELVDKGLQENDEYFLATFLTVNSAGLVLSGICCVLAARFKLANLGAFLPYSVLCGFFTSIGILIWCLGFTVDNNGVKVQDVLRSGDAAVIGSALLHHLPSVFVGVVMHLAGRKHPKVVILLLFATVFSSYAVLWVTGTSFQEAQDTQWFFSADDLVPSTPAHHDTIYGPPMPFGMFFSIYRGAVVWDAAVAGLPTVLALVFLYVIRSSLHSAALKKNIPNVTRKDPAELAQTIISPAARKEKRRRNKEKKEVLALGNILERGYAYSQFAASAVGGITAAPSIAASITMFQLRAESSAPQYGSCLFLLVFYFTDFRIVQYLPKTAFSSLMVLAGIDMCRSWIVGSFFKTKDKLEWACAPLLVVLSFTVGMLNAILLGVAISTFIFVANFYRVGTVKYVGSGLTLRSTVERVPRESAWLDENADLAQILVLQNYLFFGNAQSVFNYVQTMFDEEDDDKMVESERDQGDSYTMPPIPKFLIIDFSMVSGMDTSAIDIFREICSICREHSCKLFLSGVNSKLKSSLVYAGIKRTSNVMSYIGDLETALAQAEDALLTTVLQAEEQDMEESQRRERKRSLSHDIDAEDGFLYALKKIDEQHTLQVANELVKFRAHTTPVDLVVGEVLVRDSQNPGIYFVETGIMRVKHATMRATMSFSTASSLTEPSLVSDPALSIGHLNARGTTLGRQHAFWKKERGAPEQTFRLARVGQGWVIGSIEAASSNEVHAFTGLHVAVTDCRLHFLPYKVVRATEKTDPALSICLYKLMSLLATKRQAATIQQLDQFVKILNNPTPRLRGGKRELAKLQHW